MALTSLITVSKRSIGLVLIAVGWLCVPTSPAHACNHPAIVSFAAPDFGERIAKSTAPLVRKPAKAVAAPHNPHDPLGPCQGPQCDGQPAQPDRPLTTTAPTKARDTWNLAGTESAVAESGPISRPWLDFVVLSPSQIPDSIFHPPRHG